MSRRCGPSGEACRIDGRSGRIARDRGGHLGPERVDVACRGTTTDPQLLAKLGPVADGDWHGFLLGAAQITGAGGLGGFAVVLAWMFGREFGDGTIAGLFALPVRRRRSRSRS